jgi:hypothetical protein
MPKNESMNMFISILDEVKKEGSKTLSNSKNAKNNIDKLEKASNS